MKTIINKDCLSNQMVVSTITRSSGSEMARLERIPHEAIIKPNNDTRKYRGLVLPNQLKVILVSDPETDKSAASLNVSVGSLSDPWEKQGMAHLLEHVLFIGSKKVF